MADHTHDGDHDTETEDNYQMAIIILSSILAVVFFIGVVYMMTKWCCPSACCSGSCGPPVMYGGHKEVVYVHVDDLSHVLWQKPTMSWKESCWGQVRLSEEK